MDIVQIISTLGFPMACTVALGWFVKTTFDRISSSNEKREEKLFTTIGKQEQMLLELGNTNTKFVSALEELSDKLTATQNDVEDIKNVLKINNRKDD